MSDLISRQVLDLWNRYRPTIAVDAIEYDSELKKLLSTNLAEVGTDCISRQQAIDALRTCYDTETVTMDNGDEYINYGDAVGEIEQLPPIQSNLLQPWEVLVAQAVLPQPEIVNCKDCRKHNKKLGFDENYNITYKDDACPLIPWRGMSKGHEHDYQSCSFGERREVTT